MTNDADLRNQQIAALEDARAAVDRALALLREPGVTMTDEPAEPVPGPDWIAAKTAAGELGVHVETLKRQAAANGFGVRVKGSRWAIDRTRMQAWREARPYERLAVDDVEKC